MASAQQEVGLAQCTTADVDCLIAATRDDREAAFRLVYHSYLRAGLGEPNRHEMRVTPYHLLPTTEVFLARCRGEAIFTMSLVMEGELGLPMESLYGKELALLRDCGLNVGEVSCLADRRSRFRGFFPVFLRLSRLLVQYARRRDLDGLLLAVHPKHARFYERYMDFKLFGKEKAYPMVRNHQAVALFLDFARVDRERPENYDTFFGQPLHQHLLQPCPIPPADRDYLRRVIDPAFAPAPLGGDASASTAKANAAVAVP